MDCARLQSIGPWGEVFAHPKTVSEDARVFLERLFPSHNLSMELIIIPMPAHP